MRWTKEYKRDYNKKWREANPEKQRAHVWKHHLKKNYGMTPAEYDALLDKQGGVCAICDQPPRLYMGRLQLAVDHDHETGKVRGLLHHRCNHLMSIFDNKILFQRFMRYKRGGTVSATRSRIGRVCEYFRTADLDEVRVAYILAKEIVEKRLAAASQVPPNPAKAKRARRAKPQVAAEEVRDMKEVASRAKGETLADA